MSTLKPGDKVLRTCGEYLGMRVGAHATVKGYDKSTRCVWLEEFEGLHDPVRLAYQLTPAPPRMRLSTSSAVRKGTPITTGVLDYFPRAIAEVARCSKAGNDQHHPGKPLHWDKPKSADHADCIARHLIDRDCYDTDGVRHAAKLAWRALALLETLLENEENQNAT